MLIWPQFFSSFLDAVAVFKTLRRWEMMPKWWISSRHFQRETPRRQQNWPERRQNRLCRINPWWERRHQSWEANMESDPGKSSHSIFCFLFSFCITHIKWTFMCDFCLLCQWPWSSPAVSKFGKGRWRALFLPTSERNFRNTPFICQRSVWLSG